MKLVKGKKNELDEVNQGFLSETLNASIPAEKEISSSPLKSF